MARNGSALTPPPPAEGGSYELDAKTGQWICLQRTAEATAGGPETSTPTQDDAPAD